MDHLSVRLAIQQKGEELLIDARLLHRELEVVTKFADWIARRLADALAVEGQDFFSILGRSDAGRQTTEYLLTLDLAKQLAMLERTVRGREVRMYFIQAEKDLRSRPAPVAAALPSYADALRQLADTIEEKERVTAELALAAPKVTAYDSLMESAGTYSISAAAKLLGTGERRLFQMLRAHGILMDRARSGVENHNVPYQAHIDAGRFDLVTKSAPDGIHVSRTTRVTTRGLAWLRDVLASELVPAVRA